MHNDVFIFLCLHAARIDNYVMSLQSECEKLVSAVAVLEEEKVRSRATVGAVSASMQVVSERTQQLMANCNVILVNDGLREWHSAQADRSTVDVEANAVSLWVGRRGEEVRGGRGGKEGREREGSEVVSGGGKERERRRREER